MIVSTIVRLMRERSLNAPEAVQQYAKEDFESILLWAQEYLKMDGR